MRITQQQVAAVEHVYCEWKASAAAAVLPSQQGLLATTLAMVMCLLAVCMVVNVTGYIVLKCALNGKCTFCCRATRPLCCWWHNIQPHAAVEPRQHSYLMTYFQ
jgi:hypothetical protein